VGDAGSGSGILRLRRKIPLLFGEESLKTVCFDSFNLKQAHIPSQSGNAQDRRLPEMVLGFLARNQLVALAFA